MTIETKNEISEISFTESNDIISSIENEINSEVPSIANSNEEPTFNEITFTNSEAVKETPVEKDLTVEEIAKMEREEKIRAAQERIKKLKDISLKLKSPEGLYELEKEPSFVRQNIKLSDSNYSTESNISRYTLSEGDDKKMEIKPNNPFLHDNVD